MGYQYRVYVFASLIGIFGSATGTNVDISYTARRLQGFEADVLVKAPPATGSHPLHRQFRQGINNGSPNVRVCTVVPGDDDCPIQQTTGRPFAGVTSIYGREGNSFLVQSQFIFRPGVGLVYNPGSACQIGANICAEVIASGLNCNSCHTVGTEAIWEIPARATIVFEPPVYIARRLQGFDVAVVVKAPPATGSHPLHANFRQTINNGDPNVRVCTVFPGDKDCPIQQTTGDPFVTVTSLYGRERHSVVLSQFLFRPGAGLVFNSGRDDCSTAATICAEVIASGLNCNSCRDVPLLTGSEAVWTIPAGATIVFEPPSYTARRLQGFDVTIVVKAPPATGSNPFAAQFRQTIVANAQNICTAAAGGEDCPTQQTAGDPFLQVASVYGRDGAISPTSTFTFKAGLGLSSAESTCAAAVTTCDEVITSGLSCNSCRIVEAEPVITVPAGATIVFDPSSYTARRLEAIGQNELNRDVIVT